MNSSFSGVLLTGVLVAGLVLPVGGSVREVLAEAPSPMPVIAKPNVQTARMGGVDWPSQSALNQMHQSQYILHAAGGKLSQIPVEKVLLPHSNNMNPQSVQVDLGPNGTVYVRQPELLCNSTDGGRTWTSTPVTPPAGAGPGFQWKVLSDGTFISVGCTEGAGVRDPAVVWASTNEGQTWTQRAQIPVEMNLPGGDPYQARYTARGLSRLQDNTLLWAVDVRDNPWTEGYGLYSFRSTDGGITWGGPTLMIDWGTEGSTTLLPSGKVLAAVRYQRPKLSGDPPEWPANPWKHVFLTDSEDGGQSWTTPRQLTTVSGQTFGYPTALSDGTVVVVHDTRYGPGPAGSRAMISRDEGKTWLDEAYYLDSSVFVGSYSASVVLPDNTILTIAGSSQAGNTWDAVKDKTDLYAVRWKPHGAVRHSSNPSRKMK